MSERWGKCRRCAGMGSVMVTERDPVLLREWVKRVECSRCSGEGFSPGGFEAPWLRDEAKDLLPDSKDSLPKPRID